MDTIILWVSEGHLIVGAFVVAAIGIVVDIIVGD